MLQLAFYKKGQLSLRKSDWLQLTRRSIEILGGIASSPTDAHSQKNGAVAASFRKAGHEAIYANMTLQSRQQDGLSHEDFCLQFCDTPCPCRLTAHYDKR